MLTEDKEEPNKKNKVSSLFKKAVGPINSPRPKRFLFAIFQSVIFNFRDMAGFAKKPLRHASHISMMIVVAIILIASPFSIVMVKSKNLIDPFGANKATETTLKSDQTEEYQVAATLASVLDESLAEDAFKKASDVQVASSLTLPFAATYALAKPIVTGQEVGTAGKETFKKYTVQDGDTLWTIARANNITTDTVRWANDITDIDNVKPGTELLIPTSVGVLYTIKGGETLQGIANRYGVSLAMVESYNNVIDEELKAGMKIMVPDGVGPELPKPEPEPEPEIRIANNRTSNQTASRGSAPSAVPSSAGPNRFPYGYCTWYVASRRNIPWNGNAWQWYGNGIANGRSVGNTPVPGAVMVTWESGVGHVAYVESVNGGSFTVSEMNYTGWGRISSRTITTGQVPLIGFVY